MTTAKFRTVNSYKLSDKEQDQVFLAGNAVKGSAVFLKREFKPDLIKTGGKIVVLLSNGKKYLGKVERFTFVSKDEHIEGEIEIIRV